MERKPYKHSTKEDQRGWYHTSGKPRNKLNRGIRQRPGTLGRRTWQVKMDDVVITKPYVGPKSSHTRPPRQSMPDLIAFADSRGWNEDTIKHLLAIYRERPTQTTEVTITQGETWNNKG